MTKRLPTAVGLAVLGIAMGVLDGRPTAQQLAVLPSELQIDRAHTEALIAAWNTSARYVSGEVLVKFRTGTNAGSQGRALAMLRGRVAAGRVVGDARMVQTPDEPNPEVAAEILRRQPEVEWAQPNYLRRLNARPNDPEYSAQWNLDLIEMPAAWDINPGAGASVRVAVVDSGIATVNTTLTVPLWTGTRTELVAVPVAISPELAASRLLPGRDFVLGGPQVDFIGHGTIVAHTALQETNNNLGVAGISYGATLLPMKACLSYWDVMILRGTLNIPGFITPASSVICPDELTTAAIRAAADDGAHVIILSYGGPASSPGQLEAIRYAVQRGALVSIAVGNEFEEGNPVEYPAAYARDIDGAVAVGAIGRSQRRAYYSNTGAHVELTAPGGDFRDGGASGLILAVGPSFQDLDPATVIRPRLNRYGIGAFEGTSFSAPHVAGVAAMLRAQGITSPAAIEAVLKQSAKDLGASGRDNDYGFGLINPRAALRGMGLAR